MMKNSFKDNFSFFLVISIILLLNTMVLVNIRQLDNKMAVDWGEVLVHAVINLPMSMLLSWIDYRMVQWSIEHWGKLDFKLRIFLDFIITSAIWIGVFYVSFLILEKNGFIGEYAVSILPLSTTLLNLTVMLVFEGYLIQQQRYKAESELNLLRKEKAEYQFYALKNQLNPHFLFNCLNVLAALTRQDPEGANVFVKKLAGVYRFLLSSQHHPLVLLSEELRFVSAYANLEQVRIGDSLTVEIKNRSTAEKERKVVPASLQIAVENAIKHNICNVANPLHITIDITDEKISVSNNMQLRAVTTEKGGVGLDNLKKQCLMLGITMTTEKDNGFFKVTYYWG